MANAVFNMQEAIKKLEQAQASRVLAVAMAELMQEIVQKQAKEQAGSDTQVKTGDPAFSACPADALLRLEKKLDEGFSATDKRLTQIDTRIDKLHAEMDRRFELVSKEFELTRQDVQQRFEAFKADTDRRFELVSKDIELAKKTVVVQLGGIVGAAVTLLFAALRWLPAA